MTGTPRDAFSRPDQFIKLQQHLVEALGSWETAGVLQRLDHMCNRHGGQWRATLAEVSAEVWLSMHKTRKALDALRAGGWIHSEPVSVLDSTLVWSIRWDESQQPGEGIHQTPLENSAAKGEEIPQPSYTKSEENYRTHASADASEIERVVEHHADLVAQWSDRPRRTAATDRVAARLIAAHGLDPLLTIITWAQAHDFWRTRTATLSLVDRHAAKVREQRRAERGGRADPSNSSAEHRAYVKGLGF